MSNYNAIIKDDVVNGEGVCVSFWVQGCPHHCYGCFNPETWSFSNGKPYTSSIKWDIIKAISSNNITRNFSVLGGEPLDEQNIKMTEEIVTAVRTAYPHIKIFLWTGYTLKDLDMNNPFISSIFEKIDVVIDGRFENDQRDLSLKLRGSTNQNIWRKVDGNWRISNE